MKNTPLKVICWPIGDFNFPSSRFRLYSLLPNLDNEKIALKVLKGGNTSIVKVIFAFLLLIFSDCLFIQKRLLPPLYLKLIKLLKKKIIYDFDDALFATPPFQSDLFPHIIEDKNRLIATLKVANCVIAGNNYLAGYARKYCQNVKVVATAYPVNDTFAKKHQNSDQVVVGWVGTKANLFYVEKLKNVFINLQNRYPEKVIIKVVSDGVTFIEGVSLVNKEWKLKDEVNDLLTFDIGIMPITEDDWSKGKCSFKAIQMMAHGIPVIASPVGMNQEVIEEGVTGFLANTEDEWTEKMSILINSWQLREKMGKEAKEFIERNFNPGKTAESLQQIIIESCRV